MSSEVMFKIKYIQWMNETNKLKETEPLQVQPEVKAMCSSAFVLSVMSDPA